MLGNVCGKRVCAICTGGKGLIELPLGCDHFEVLSALWGTEIPVDIRPNKEHGAYVYICVYLCM